jgi:hypothetical protein
MPQRPPASFVAAAEKSRPFSSLDSGLSGLSNGALVNSRHGAFRCQSKSLFPARKLRKSLALAIGRFVAGKAKSVRDLTAP